MHVFPFGLHGFGRLCAAEEKVFEIRRWTRLVEDGKMYVNMSLRNECAGVETSLFLLFCVLRRRRERGEVVSAHPCKQERESLGWGFRKDNGILWA